MENNIFDKVGKSLPYKMPEGFDVNMLMDKAISMEQGSCTNLAIENSGSYGKRKSARILMWLGSSAAAAAVAVLVFALKPTTAVADPTADYHDALAQYCSHASSDEMEKRMDMVDADYVVNIDNYEAYYN